MKKWVFRLAGIFIVLVIIALVFVFINLNSLVKKGVETVGPQLTKVDVRLGSAKLSPMNGNGELSKLFVGNPEGYKTPSAIEVGNIKVALNLRSALSDTIVVDEIIIQAPVITFEGGLTGNNLRKILSNLDSASDKEKEAASKGSGGSGGKKIMVKDLIVQGGKINVSALGQGFTVALPEFHVQNIGTAENGVSQAELAKQILKPILVNVIKASTEALVKNGGDLKSIGTESMQKIDKATKDLKNIFKK